MWSVVIVESTVKINTIAEAVHKSVWKISVIIINVRSADVIFCPSGHAISNPKIGSARTQGSTNEEKRGRERKRVHVYSNSVGFFPITNTMVIRVLKAKVRWPYTARCLSDNSSYSRYL